jgi:hypothetical protein
MPYSDLVTDHLYGMYRDVLRDPQGNVLWDRGWQKNVIVDGCRVLLTELVRGSAGVLGIQGVQIGTGLASWDTAPQPPTPAETTLQDAHPFTVPSGSLQFDFVQLDGTVSGIPTNRLQIRAVMGPNVPTWPDVNHPTITLREFGLVGQLSGAVTPQLMNYVRHPAIIKDPVSTLERTIWLTF